MSPQSTPIVWSGKHRFSVTGTGRHEDTLRIEAGAGTKTERPLTLILPTLCITYADMAFANAIGGVQEPYPASAAYGPRYFDPPVVLAGEEAVEKWTWIRGAHRVVIGPQETTVEWYPRKALVIPRLHIDTKDPAVAWLTVDQAPVEVDSPLVIKVKQIADGRHIGGIRIEKRHPDWRPPEQPKDYDLWVRVIDGDGQGPLPEAPVNLLRWDPKLETEGQPGGFAQVNRRYTSGSGVVEWTGRPADELEAVALDLPGWRAVPRAFRPLPGQQTRLHLVAWRLQEDTLPHTWRIGDSLDALAELTAHEPAAILKLNGLAHASELVPGKSVLLPCYAATYRMEPSDRFEWLAVQFGFDGVKGLAEALGLGDVSALHHGLEIKLPGWHFVYARRGDTVESIEQDLGLKPGSARAVGRAYRPHRDYLYEREVVAVTR